MDILLGIAFLVVCWLIVRGAWAAAAGEGGGSHDLASHTSRTEKAEDSRARQIREGEETQRRIKEREAEAARARAQRAAERARRRAERDDGAWS
ncbi:hypothetical protein BST28_17510 [Mycolicibacter kumamotonensis]|uniref:Uncharacterized protein n=1 Tax=Mycolicibacter kumamotonensis TaxID=354243 RepID=A0A1X0E0N7_9MYCO|nr:hypothetical protein [Mycolicibacter kumamotonensis]ORA77600.1 hypothetical protein BST28_17510 [Mycolicibacter kumamotonensis]